MVEYAFFLQKVDWWRKDMALLWGDISIFLLHCIGSNFPVIPRQNCPSWMALRLGEGQKLCHDITFLLVLAEEGVTGARNYGLLTVWVNPSQARVPSMEEVVGKLTACTFSGPNWPYVLLQLHEGTCNVPLPKEEHLGILPQRGAEATPCGWISQLEVCQLLIASPQVIYLIGLKGCNELVITSLQELLASSVSLTMGKPVYLEIDILPPPVEDPDQKVPPLGEVSTIVVTSPPKSNPLKSEGEGRMTMEVRTLLSWAVLETSGCGSKNLTPRRPNPVVIPMPPPQKSEELLQPVDTSYQASAEVAEASLEGIPTSISPIAVASRTGSITPPVDALDLWANANKALKDLLTTKASIDTHRQRAVWELGIELYWNESQAAESIREAKAVCSWVTLDAQITCSQLTLDTKTTCSAAVKEAKTTQDCIIHEAGAACFTAIRDIEAQRASQGETLQREHGNIIWDLEREVIQEESRSQVDLLSACQAALYISPLELKSTLATSYHILLGQTPPSPPFVLLQRASPWKNCPLQLPLPHQCSSSLLGPKDGTLPQILWRACLWVKPLQRQLWEDPPSPSGKRSHPGIEHSSWAMPRHLAGTLTW